MSKWKAGGSVEAEHVSDAPPSTETARTSGIITIPPAVALPGLSPLTTQNVSASARLAPSGIEVDLSGAPEQEDTEALLDWIVSVHNEVERLRIPHVHVDVREFGLVGAQSFALLVQWATLAGSSAVAPCYQLAILVDAAVSWQLALAKQMCAEGADAVILGQPRS